MAAVIHNRDRICVRLLLLVGLAAITCGAWAQRSLAEAELLVAAGKWAQAEGALQPLAAAEPQNFRAHLLLGQARYKQGKLTTAARSLTTARLLDPRSAEAAHLLGSVRFAQEDYAAAVQALQDAMNLGSSDALTSYRLGLAYQEAGRAVDAQKTLYAAAFRHPTHTPTIAALARVDLELGRASVAAYWFRKAFALKPSDTGLFHEMIDALIAAGSFLSAQTELKRHLADNPEDVDALRSLASVYNGLGLSIEARGVYEKLEGMGVLKQSDRIAFFNNLLAAALWERALGQYEYLRVVNDEGIHDAAGGAFAQLGHYDEAAAALLRAQELAPSSARMRLLAGVYSSAGRHTEAYQIYDGLVGSGNDRELIAAAAGSALKAGLFNEGIGLLNLLAATEPDSYELRVLVADTAEEAGDLREALKQWSVAAELEGADVTQSRIALARIAAAAGYRTWSLEQLGQLDLAGLTPDQLVTVAHLADALADGATATRAAGRVLEADTAEAPLYAAAAEILLDWDATGAAIRLPDRYGAHPADPMLADAYARWLIATSHAADAIGVCEKAIIANPLDPLLYATALDAAESADLWDTAIALFADAIGQEGDNAIAADFLRVAYERGYGTERAATEMVGLARKKDSPPVLAAAGRALREARMWSEAAEYYKRLVNEYGRSAATEAAECYIRAGRLSKARDVLLQSLPITAGHDTIAAVAAGAPLDAALTLLETEPGGVAYYLTAAKLFAASEKTSEGIAFFEGLAATNGVLEAQVAKAYLLQWKGDHAQAISNLRALPPTLASDPDAALLLAWAYLGAGNFVAAQSTAYGVLSQDSATRRRVHEVAGQAAVGMSDPEGALRHFCLALAANPHSAVAADGIGELCRMRMLPYTSVRRRLTDVYRYSSNPGPVLSLARRIAEMPGYERLSRWVRDRAAGGG